MKRTEAQSGKSGFRQFPERFKLEAGQEAVMIALEFRAPENANGTVAEVVIRGAPQEKSYSFWWPRKLPFAPVHTPFAVQRVNQKQYVLLVPDTDAEMLDLWRNGIPKSAGSMPETPADAGSKVPAKYQTVDVDRE